MPFWPEPRSDECNFLSLKLSTLCSALMNSIVPSTNQVLPLLEQLTQPTRDRGKLLQSPHFFRPFTPTLLTPRPLPTSILYSPQFHSHKENKMAARRTQRWKSTISRKNRGLWTVYSTGVTDLTKALGKFHPLSLFSFKARPLWNLRISPPMTVKRQSP